MRLGPNVARFSGNQLLARNRHPPRWTFLTSNPSARAMRKREISVCDGGRSAMEELGGWTTLCNGGMGA